MRISRFLTASFIAIFLIFTLIGTSFSETWEKTFAGDPIEAEGRSVQQTSDGGFIIAGGTWRGSHAAGGWDVLLIKTNALGSEDWRKTFGGSGFDSGNSVQQTNDGGYIIAGSTSSYGSGGRDALLIKTNAEGNLVWIKTFGGGASDSAKSVRKTSDGGYIIVGSSEPSDQVIYLIKTDANGNEMWSKIFGEFRSAYGYSVQQTVDHGYIIAGLATDPIGAEAVYLIKTDTNGNQEWSKTFSTKAEGTGAFVKQTSDGGYIIAATTEIIDTTRNDGILLIKTDDSGNIKWIKSLGKTYWVYALELTSDGGYIIAGLKWYSDDGKYWTGGILLKTDANGNETWSKSFEGSHVLNSVQQTIDGGYIGVGNTDLGNIYLVYFTLKLPKNATDNKYIYNTINFPGADRTIVWGINDYGHVVGDYENSSGVSRGFLYDGTFTSLDYPGAIETFAFGINNSGVIVGFYKDNDSNYYGFIYNGIFTSLDYPGAVGTRLYGINESNQIVGSYWIDENKFYGFKYDNNFSNINLSIAGAEEVLCFDINDHGQITGRFLDSNLTYHGYIHENNSTTIIDYPGSGYTRSYGINNFSRVVGYYWENNPSGSGYFSYVLKGNKFVSFSYPGSFNTESFDINNYGQIAGYYSDMSGIRHGFIATPRNNSMPWIPLLLLDD